MTDDEIISVVQAHKDGKIIQCRDRMNDAGNWIDITETRWNFNSFNYRVKPEPRKPREWWVGEMINGGITSITDAKRIFLVREVIDQ